METGRHMVGLVRQFLCRKEVWGADAGLEELDRQ